VGIRDRVKRLERCFGGKEPVRINVLQEGPEGREDELEPLYSFTLNPSGDEKPLPGGAVRRRNVEP
jgi:hypothetical protein